MPTARELLEQADALMRRNRGREPEPDIPELTDEVALTEPPRALRREPDRAASLEPPPEDVPELTDAIGRIEEVSIEPLPDEEPLPDDEEESRWFESVLGGSSVTGPAPDSVAVVPPSTLRSAEPAAGPPTPGPDLARSDEHKLSPETAAALALADAARVADPAFDAILGLRPAEGASGRELAPPELPPELTEALAQEAADAPVAETPAVYEAPIDEVPPPVREEVAPAEAEEETAPKEAQEEVAPAGVQQEVPPPPEEEVSPPPALPPSWDAVAEEIRMQVLQRIDIFTDTGLHGELAARLQPVVDRASADLIATINREVGQLLRTYVAEAIEREIEKWRQSNP